MVIIKLKPTQILRLCNLAFWMTYEPYKNLQVYVKEKFNGEFFWDDVHPFIKFEDEYYATWFLINI